MKIDQLSQESSYKNNNFLSQFEPVIFTNIKVQKGLILQNSSISLESSNKIQFDFELFKELVKHSSEQKPVKFNKLNINSLHSLGENSNSPISPAVTNFGQCFSEDSFMVEDEFDYVLYSPK